MDPIPEKLRSNPNPIFENIQFVGSFTSVSKLPNKPLFEIALIGKSNVGKSSLINHLSRKKMAKISQKPGKTQVLNLFEIDQSFYLMDLPGYGYAKVPERIKREWQTFIEEYFLNRKNLKLTLCLFDFRHKLTEKDLQTLAWASTLKIPIALVLTKTDKLSQKEQGAMLKYYQNILEELNLSDYPLILYSIHETEGRKKLILTIKKYIHAQS